jgi:hypothetical protein
VSLVGEVEDFVCVDVGHERRRWRRLHCDVSSVDGCR